MIHILHTLFEKPQQRYYGIGGSPMMVCRKSITAGGFSCGWICPEQFTRRGPFDGTSVECKYGPADLLGNLSATWDKRIWSDTIQFTIIEGLEICILGGVCGIQVMEDRWRDWKFMWSDEDFSPFHLAQESVILSSNYRLENYINRWYFRQKENFPTTLIQGLSSLMFIVIDAICLLLGTFPSLLPFPWLLHAVLLCWVSAPLRRVWRKTIGELSKSDKYLSSNSRSCGEQLSGTRVARKVTHQKFTRTNHQ